jgi:hypothetical protein
MIINLINSLGDIEAVSLDAARANEKAADRLVDHVNDELETNSRIIELIARRLPR